MKLPSARIEGFLKRPDPAVLVILLYGSDDGLVRERAAAAVTAAAGSLDDPFRVATLAGPELARDPARLADEAAALSMMGGQRVVWVRETGDGASPAVKQALDFVPDGGLVVLEAGDLEPRSSLRKLCEASPRAATIGCYMPDEAAVEGLVRSLVREAGYRLDPDALAMLAENLVADRQLIRREVEKLLLHAGEEKTITLPMAAASVGDSAEQTVEDAVFLAADGDIAGADRAAEKVLAEGTSPVALLRAAQRHLLRLHLAGAHMANGDDAEAAMARLRPPVFFKVKTRFRGQLLRWQQARLADAMARLVEAEAGVKRTGAPEDTLARRTLLQIASLARPSRLA